MCDDPYNRFLYNDLFKTKLINRVKVSRNHLVFLGMNFADHLVVFFFIVHLLQKASVMWKHVYEGLHTHEISLGYKLVFWK